MAKDVCTGITVGGMVNMLPVPKDRPVLDVTEITAAAIPYPLLVGYLRHITLIRSLTLTTVQPCPDTDSWVVKRCQTTEPRPDCHDSLLLLSFMQLAPVQLLPPYRLFIEDNTF